MTLKSILPKNNFAVMNLLAQNYCAWKKGYLKSTSSDRRGLEV